MDTYLLASLQSIFYLPVTLGIFDYLRYRLVAPPVIILKPLPFREMEPFKMPNRDSIPHIRYQTLRYQAPRYRALQHQASDIRPGVVEAATSSAGHQAP